MTNDAKLGLVAGVGIVVMVAVLLFQKETTSKPEAVPTAAARTKATPGEHVGIVRPATPTSTTRRAEPRQN